MVDQIADKIIPGFGALLAALAWRHSRQVNKAVNNVPKGDPTILDRVKTIEDRLNGIERKLP